MVKREKKPLIQKEVLSNANEPKGIFFPVRKAVPYMKKHRFCVGKKIGVYPPVEKAIKFAVDYLKS